MKRKETVKVNFTVRVLEAVKVPKDGRVTLKDTKEDGLGFLVLASGHKSFTWFRKLNGIAQYKTIGSFPATTIEQARKKAREYNGDRDTIKESGSGQMFAERDGKSLDGIFADYMLYRKAAAKSSKGPEEDQEKYDRFLAKPLGRKKLGQITRPQLREIHASIPAKRVANMTIQLLRRVINYAIKEDMWLGTNPTTGLRLHKESSRERFLLPSELPRLLPELEKRPDLKDFVFLTIQTGARKSNVCAMRWDAIQEIGGDWVWMISKSKTDPYNVPLLPSVVTCLVKRGLHKEEKLSPWVFPSCSKAGHVLDFKKSWGEARKAAGLPDLRIHDLRRTTGSWLAASGASLPQIGKMLNHKSPVSTAIYARLQLDPVREQLKAAMGLLNG